MLDIILKSWLRLVIREYLKESNEFDSLSCFLRVVAHRHIATEDEDLSIDPEEIIETVDTAIAPISERLGQVEEHIVEIDSNVNNDDKIDKLARDLYSSLLTGNDKTELPEIDDPSKYSNASDLVLAQSISTPYFWAEYYDEEVADVRRACARMLEYYPDVDYSRVETGGQTATFRPR